MTAASTATTERPELFANSSRETGRNLVYDVLRSLGLFLIVLAHVKPPPAVWCMRNFDVPLMVLVSAAVFQLGYAGRSIAVGAYLRKRTVRLLAPVYVFLAFYFIVSALLTPGRFNGTMILRTFLLLDGIGFVWVIRVFLIVAIVAPFLLRWRQSLSRAVFIALLGAIYLAHEALFAVFAAHRDFIGDDVVEFTVFYLLPYTVVFGLGLRWPGMSRLEAFVVGLGCLIVGVALWRMLPPMPLEDMLHDHKYPPRLLYVWYGLGVSHLLYAALMPLRNLPDGLRSVVEWISASSLWIYLWHIPGLTIASKMLHSFAPAQFRFLAAWLVTLTFAIVATFVQKRVVQWVIERGHWRAGAADTLAIVFLK